jgi:signal transduction histidine kinase
VSKLPPLLRSRSRLVARRAMRKGESYTVYVASSLAAVDDSTKDLAGLLVVALPLLLLVMAAVTWVLTGRALRPVEMIRSEVEVIGAEDLHRRVPEPSTGDEIQRLAHTMNRMLARLEGANDRQRRFVADASHELRSPLAAIRAQLEVSLAYPDQGDRRQIEGEMLADTLRLQRLVDDLLALSKLEADDGGRRFVPVDLDVIVLREARRLRTHTGADVDTAGVSGAQISGDEDQLTQVVRNLLDNAGRHASSSIRIALVETSGDARLTVADDGPGIGPDDRERIFERFARLDGGRERDAGGAGLGLAIARAIVVAHGGRIEVDDGPGASFTITLPLAPADGIDRTPG